MNLRKVSNLFFFFFTILLLIQCTFEKRFDVSESQRPISSQQKATLHRCSHQSTFYDTFFSKSAAVLIPHLHSVSVSTLLTSRLFVIWLRLHRYIFLKLNKRPGIMDGFNLWKHLSTYTLVLSAAVITCCWAETRLRSLLVCCRSPGRWIAASSCWGQNRAGFGWAADSLCYPLRSWPSLWLFLLQNGNDSNWFPILSQKNCWQEQDGTLSPFIQ